MEPLERKVAGFIRDKDLFAGAGRVLLAVSGGADSIALLHVMHRLASKGTIDVGLFCAHLNHGLRGAEGDGDEAFVVQQAAELNLPLISRAIDVKAHAHAHRLSIETAARQLRLGSLIEIARTHGCSSIAMGHQKNDNAETILQRLQRGTGYRGLAGIRPSRQVGDNLTFVRPLLCCCRDEILDYLQSQNVTWREDHTNDDCTYTRNRIRHRLLPTLQATCSASLVEELAALSVSAGRLHARVCDEAKAAIERHAKCDGSKAMVDAAALAALPEPVAVELLRQLLTRLGLCERDLTRYHYEDLRALAGRRCPKQKMSLPDDFSAQHEYDLVILRRPTPPSREHDLLDPVELRISGTTSFGPYRIDAQVIETSQVERAAITDGEDPFLEYFDLDAVMPPLVVRRRRPGDRFIPLGQQSDKKIGKFLTAAKVPDDMRSHTLIIEDAKRILWLCPIRISERAKVTEKTSVILALRLTEGVAEIALPYYK